MADQQAPQPAPSQPLTKERLKEVLASILGAVYGLIGPDLPEGMEVSLGAPNLDKAAANAALLGAVAGTMLPMPGGGKKKVVGEAVDVAARVARRADAPTVWHGSGKKFDTVDINKLKTGQGQLAFGPGVYASTAPEVGAEYAIQRAAPGVVGTVGRGRDVPPQLRELALALNVPHELGPEITSARSALANILKSYGNTGKYPEALAQLGRMTDDELNKLFRFYPGQQGGPGYLYEMRMHANPNRIVDWGTDIRTQHPEVQKGLLDVLGFLDLQDAVGPNMLGRTVLRRIFNATPTNRTPEVMKEVGGLDAVRYKAGQIQPPPKGTPPAQNYVGWDDKLFEVVRRYFLGDK